MGDQVVANKPAESKPRVLKKAETMREKAEQSVASASQAANTPSMVRLTLRYIAAPFKFIFRPLAKPLKRLGRTKTMHFIGLILLPRYFRNSWKELRQVTWPNRRQSWQLTSAVIIFATIFGVLIAGVDFGLNKLFKELLLR